MTLPASTVADSTSTDFAVNPASVSALVASASVMPLTSGTDPSAGPVLTKILTSLPLASLVLASGSWRNTTPETAASDASSCTTGLNPSALSFASASVRLSEVTAGTDTVATDCLSELTLVYSQYPSPPSNASSTIARPTNKPVRLGSSSCISSGRAAAASTCGIAPVAPAAIAGGTTAAAITVVAFASTEILSGQVALLGLLGEQLQDDGLEPRWHAGDELRRTRRPFLDMLVSDRHRRIADERRASAQDLVEHHTERIEIAAGIDVEALGLFGGEVRGGAHDRTGLGEIVGGRRQRPGDAEVGHLGDPGGGDDDVAGLHVAVHDTALVCRSEGTGNLEDDLRRTTGLERS